MKNIKLFVAVVMAAIALTSCNCFNQMAKNQDEVNITCTPEVLALNNGKVEADITVTFPQYYFNKKDELKRIEFISPDGTTSIFKVYECSSKVKDSIFEVPKGYKPLTEEALQGFMGNLGV